ncbi:MAG: hypothetical protein QGG71_03260, partial [Pirellulaceae bacterium]|nr:hypothetical protein [Pirellulaceae bacterium]
VGIEKRKQNPNDRPAQAILTLAQPRPSHNTSGFLAPHVVGWFPDQPTFGEAFQGRAAVGRGFKTD